MYKPEHDVLTCVFCPKEHCATLQSTNSIRRLNSDIKRHTVVADTFPDEEPDPYRNSWTPGTEHRTGCRARPINDTGSHRASRFPACGTEMRRINTMLELWRSGLLRNCMTLYKTATNRLLAALVALALAVLGQGHAMLPGPTPDPMIADYIKAGGSIDDLCLSEPAGDDPSQAHPQDCPVCQLVKALALPTWIDTAVPEAAGAREGHAICRQHPASRQVRPLPPARGPPSILV